MRLINADELEKRLIEKGFYPAIVKRTIEEMPDLKIHTDYYGTPVAACEECGEKGHNIYIDNNNVIRFRCESCIFNGC